MEWIDGQGEADRQTDRYDRLNRCDGIEKEKTEEFCS